MVVARAAPPRAGRTRGSSSPTRPGGRARSPPAASGARPRFVWRTTPVALTTPPSLGCGRRRRSSVALRRRSPGSWPAAISSRAARERLAGGRHRRRARQRRDLPARSELVDGRQLAGAPCLESRRMARPGLRPAHRARLLRRLRGEVLGGAPAGSRRAAAARRRPRSARRARAVRRRRGLPARRRACARLHGRLLPADRRRPGDVRSDRRDERPQRRLRHGRDAAARALGRGVPGVAAGRGASAAILEAPPAKVREAGGVLAGGHTLRDEEPHTGSPSSALSRRTRSGRRPARGPATRST